ncbi:MAG: type II toxin-antitoxin system VapC family toxin [Roseiarcus sp.]
MSLLDTNVVSELRRVRPHGAVVAWLNSVSKTSLRLCAVTLGEIQRGVEMTRARDPANAREIEIWADKLENSFAVIPAAAAVFRCHARLMQRRSDSIYEDALIAATALVHDFVVVTRDVADFEGFGAKVLDPFHFPTR